MGKIGYRGIEKSIKPRLFARLPDFTGIRSQQAPLRESGAAVVVEAGAFASFAKNSGHKTMKY